MAPHVTETASDNQMPSITSLTQAQLKANAAPSPVADLDASKLVYHLTDAPRKVPLPDDPVIASCSVCTDHMITARWTSASGWAAPEVVTYGPLSLLPTSSVLHYATECFEGLKLYRGYDGNLRLFRPDRNAARMSRSSSRIALPSFPPSELVSLITSLCALDGPKWLPRSRPGKFLYLRPTLISDDPSLGVQRPNCALLFIVLTMFPDMSDPMALSNSGPSPVGPVPDASAPVAKLSNPASGLRLLASKEDTIRAWPGGFGSAKLGANYGPTLLAQGEARARGFNQILWLFGPEAHVTEAGASNFFIVMRSATDPGRVELITAGLEEKVILEGVTRASILHLARERLASELTVVERKYTMAEVQAAVDEGRLLEAFAAGTAFFVAPVTAIEWKGRELEIPTGKVASTLRAWLSDIMYGNEQHPWGVVVPEKEQ